MVRVKDAAHFGVPMKSTTVSVLSSIVLCCSLLPVSAQAFEFADQGFLLDPPSSGWFTQGIGAPTVVYNPDTTEYVLYFESQSTTAASGCASEWTIGRATSPDGLSWTLDATPVLQPSSTSWYGCSVAQPTVVYDGVLWRMWFKGNGTTSTKGIGYAESADGVTWSVDASPVVTSTGTLGDPAAVMLNGDLHLYYTLGTSIYHAYSVNDGTTWTANPTPVISPDASISWMTNSVSGASATVMDTGDIHLFFYGTNASSTKGFGYATSYAGITAGSEFDIDPAEHLLSTGSAPTWSHWDVVQTVGSEFLAYYSKNNSSGVKALGLAVEGAIPWTEPLDRAAEVTSWGAPDSLFEGNDASGQAGFSLANAGDVDGDGTDDLLIGAPFANITEGNVFLVYGGQDLENLSLDDIGVTVDGVVLRADSPQHWAGYSVAGAGDVDGDGYADLVIGAPHFAYPTASPRGAAYVLYGPFGTTGSIDLEDVGDTTLGATHRGAILRGKALGDNFGWAVSGAGDVNADGYDDIVIGAPGISSNTGGSYVVYGPIAEEEIDAADINSAIPGAKIAAQVQPATQYAGHAVAGIGDFNADGYDDVAVSSLRADMAAGYLATGAVFVYHGPLAAVETSTSSDLRMYGPNGNDRVGLSLAAAGDVNQDGYDDFLTTARRKDSDAGRGATYLVYGPQTGVRRTYIAETSIRGTEAETSYDGSYPSTTAASAGDFDGDGYPDLIIGASFQDDGLSDAGAAYLFTGVAKAYSTYTSATAVTLGGAVDDFYGCAVAGLDFNGDGFSDVAIGARGDDDGGAQAGSVTVIYGSP